MQILNCGSGIIGDLDFIVTEMDMPKEYEQISADRIAVQIRDRVDSFYQLPDIDKEVLGGANYFFGEFDEPNMGELLNYYK